MENPRRVAAAALMKQEKNGYANLVLAHALQSYDGGARERAFVSVLFYGTVERLVTIDFLLEKFIAKPLNKLDAEVRAVLRTGLYQARWMDSVPVPAAIDESVKLVRKMGKSSAAGMVNAVLRRACAVDLSCEKFATEQQRLCVLYSVCAPMAALLLRCLPEEAEPLLAASFTQPALCIRANTLKTTADALAKQFAAQGVVAQPGMVSDSLSVAYKGDITASPLFQSGLFHVQGEASQLACRALAPKPGQKVVDLCAAPGGKSATLAQYLQNTGVLFSCDAAKNRLSLIETVLKRLGVTCAKVMENDAAVPCKLFENADAVLCDVPCSGLGILAKKPDIRQKNLAGLSELVVLQRRILQTAGQYVRPGGRLVYSTCTVNPEENEDVVTEFLRNNPTFRVVPIQEVPKGAIVRDGMVTLYPHRTKTDGFFVAAMERL